MDRAFWRRVRQRTLGFYSAGAITTGIRKVHEYKTGVGKRDREIESSKFIKSKMLRGSNNERVNVVEEESGNDVEMTARGTPMATTGHTETSITPQVPQYGFNPTHTAVIPFTAYFSVVPEVDDSEPNVFFRMRMNSIKDIVRTNFGTPTAGAPIGAGLFNLPLGWNTNSWPNPLGSFPDTLTNGDTERAAWATVFERMYNFYTVLGTEVTVELLNYSDAILAHMMVASYMESSSAQNQLQVRPAATLEEMQYWPDVQFTRVANSADDTVYDNRAYIRYTWTPKKVHKAVENDEDNKRWTPVGETPTLEEDLVLTFAKPWDYPPGTSVPRAICRVTARYIVQFKDLQTALRYPTIAGTQSSVVIDFPADIIP